MVPAESALAANPDKVRVRRRGRLRVLGIEGTAHTCGVGIVDDEAGRCRVLTNQVRMLRPETGGIHPREAADHHVAAVGDLLRDALADAGLKIRDLDGIAFSQGPGLGPCLRVVASAARALAIRHELPLLAVNHCVAHLEVGRGTTGATDPVMLYASGANTQVIAEARGRYRVFGETLDIGIGNALDKFAREQGLPFPGGPRIEELAAEGQALLAAAGGRLPELPYSVKGMDVAFSGSVTAAQALLQKGVPLPVVCHALQEWCFAMLVEVTERAVAHTGKSEVLLGGGVGRNRRLQEMLRQMIEARGGTFHCPEPRLLSDNGAMIAWNGLLLLQAGQPTAVEASEVDQKYRTDDVELVWRTAQTGTTTRSTAGFAPETKGFAPFRGAEALVRPTAFLGHDAVVKERIRKGYRHPDIEQALVAARMRHEARLLVDAHRAGAPVPAVLDADPGTAALVLERIPGPQLRAVVEDPGAIDLAALFRAAGAAVADLHAAGVVHGDLTTSNLLLEETGGPALIDFGLAERTEELEDHAVDLHVLQEALRSTHARHAALWTAFLEGYAARRPEAKEILHRLEQIAARGRYRSMLG